MTVYYNSTRNKKERVTASEAILRGLSADGGLYVPENIPALQIEMKELMNKSYQEIALLVMSRFLTDFSEEELKECIDRAYDDKFDVKEIAPIQKKGHGYYLELYHGATIAFKDMALSILPHLMTAAAKKKQVKNEIVILTATSGDTGKAAMAGFADVPGTRIIVFYPKNGVSTVQEKQMLTQKGENTCVVGLYGNFDDAQSGVKELFNDEELKIELAKAGYQLSSANSINIGRLVPQIVYYVYAYAALLKAGEIKEGELLNVVVPTGNFGNILAACYAKQMGTPIGKLICASNENKVLYDFFSSGAYDKNREFKLTNSPSMDILVSSNLERLIYQISGKDDEKNAGFMKALKENGCYQITDEMKEQLEDFYGNYASDEETAQEIKQVFEEYGYLLDTHTAVASKVYRKYRNETGDKTKALIVSTASPYKFSQSVMEAIAPQYQDLEEFALIDQLSLLSGTKIPNAIEEIRTAPIRHHLTAEKKGMKDVVRKILGVIE